VRYYVTIGSRAFEVELGGEGLLVDGERLEADLMELDGTEVRTLLLGGRSHRVLAARTGEGVWSLYLSGRHLTAEVVDERTRSIREMTGEKEGSEGPSALRAPMPGLVVKVEVAEGDEVFPGQGLVIVEAMKMENELRSEAHGRVTRVGVEAGDPVDKNQVLVEFEAL
jgi:pyruvate carboxylase subunit B